MKGWDDSFIAVDWGTTNRRAYLIGPDGGVVQEMEDDLGVSSVAQGAFPAAVSSIRERLGDPPLLMAGMIGSNRGWHEAPYVRCPVGPDELVAQLAWVEPGRIAIVPGVAFVDGATGDVMRGEEVQVFGLLREQTVVGSTICHPGTHTKWISVDGNVITRFRTVMTGELFSLLREHSILAPLLKAEPQVSEAFFDGVHKGFSEGELSAELFAIRARVLLSLLPDSEASSFASGLLIGCDLRAGLEVPIEEEVVVLGRPSLTRLYAAALRHCGRPAREVDGAQAFVAGMMAIREAIQ